MKQTKKIMNRQLLEGIQPFVSEDFRRQIQGMVQELKIEEEQTTMKQKRYAAVLMTALLIVSLTGAALGIVNHFGILDFLSPESGLDFPSGLVQTEFTQDGGTVGDVSVRVRDAVCDGLTLFVAVEATVNNPADGILVTMNDMDFCDAAGIEWQKIRPYEADHPDFEALQSAANIHYIGPWVSVMVFSSSNPDSIIPLIGVNWRYEGIGTVVANLMINVQELENPDEALTVEIHNATFQKVTAAEYEEMYGKKANDPAQPIFIWLEEIVLSTEISAGKMETRTAKAETPFTYDGFIYNRLEVTTSPLATYVTINKKSTATIQEGKNTALYTKMLDENGNAFELLSFISMQMFLPNADGNYDGIPMQHIYKRSGDLPEEITLCAAAPRGEGTPLPNDLVVKLTEVTE